MKCVLSLLFLGSYSFFSLGCSALSSTLHARDNTFPSSLAWTNEAASAGVFERLDCSSLFLPFFLFAQSEIGHFPCIREKGLERVLCTLLVFTM